MSDCFLSADRLADYADGSMAPPDRAAVESHLDNCARCRDELAWLRTLAADAGTLPRAIAPGRDLWSGIAPHLVVSQQRRFLRIRPLTLAAAAVILTLLSVAGTALWLRQPDTPGSIASHSPAPSVLPAGTNDQAQALAALVIQVRSLEQSLPAATRALVSTQLAQIDAAIQESEAALAGRSDDPAIERMLAARYHQRLELLQQAQRVGRQS